MMNNNSYHRMIFSLRERALAFTIRLITQF